LKEENLAISLGTDVDHWADCVTIFTVEVKLTKHALDKTDQVVEATYQYLQRIRDAGVQEYFATELNDVGAMNFKYTDKTAEVDTVVGFARQMQ